MPHRLLFEGTDVREENMEVSFMLDYCPWKGRRVYFIVNDDVARSAVTMYVCMYVCMCVCVCMYKI
jgi:uncharacterized protein (DUF427 family)